MRQDAPKRVKRRERKKRAIVKQPKKWDCYVAFLDSTGRIGITMP